MRKFVFAVLVVFGVGLFIPKMAVAYNFGDYRSVTLTSKAWDELDKGDIEAVLAYTNKCLELYGEQAKNMQKDLGDYPTGSNQQIFGYWALNDVATCLFIQGEAYRKANMIDEAKEVYRKLIGEYAYGQCWDKQGWFWKPAEAAQEKLATLESGSNLDFGDYTSSTLTTKAWQALGENNLDAVIAYTDKCIELYQDKAKEMQLSLREYPWESNEKIFGYWALNDVGTCLFIRGEAYRKAEKTKEAKQAYKKLIDEYYFSQCWDTNGWFWKPAEAAEQKMDALDAMS
jgi:tetratricopeptide (TPR) repeat protein